MRRLNLRAFLMKMLSEEVCETPKDDLAELAGSLHFGRPAGWVYADFGDGWPFSEPRPIMGWLGAIPMGVA